MRIQQQVGAQHAGDGAAGAYHRDLRVGILQHLSERRHHSAEQVERDEAPMPHGVFHIVAKNPQIEHVARQMHEPAMQEHGSENRQTCRDDRQFRRQGRLTQQHRRNHAQGIDGHLIALPAQGNLPEIHQDAGDDENHRHHGGDVGGIVVVQWNHNKYNVLRAIS